MKWFAAFAIGSVIGFLFAIGYSICSSDNVCDMPTWEMIHYTA